MDRPAAHPHEAAGLDGAQSRAKALADPTRAEIHRLLSAAPDGLTIAELAADLSVHRTAIGQHLAILAEAGLVERSTRPPAGRGRPVSAFRAIEHDPYRALAGWLAEAVRTRRSAREVGHEVGERLVADGAGDDPIETVVREATRLGFAPVARPRRNRTGVVDVVLHRCPYAEIAAADPATVCQLHLGLAEGVAERTGGLVVDGLKVADPHRAGCRLTLRRQPPSA